MAVARLVTEVEEEEARSKYQRSKAKVALHQPGIDVTWRGVDGRNHLMQHRSYVANPSECEYNKEN